MKTIKIIIADDHAITLLGIRTTLKDKASICIVDEANDGFELITKTAVHKPDIVITDLKMESLNGFDAILLLKKKHPTTKVIVYSGYQNDETIFKVLNIGADGFIGKNGHFNEIYTAIKTVLQNEKYFPERFLNEAPIILNKLKKEKERIKKELSPRELQVAILASKALSNLKISEQLKLKRRTVEIYLGKVYDKLDVHSRSQLLLKMRENNLLSINFTSDENMDNDILNLL
ncbi:MAG: hypothetical protein RL708_2229 [Bacteroidota bacterium]|jgi:DNA-binding NarL/FixJ family response regulator